MKTKREELIDFVEWISDNSEFFDKNSDWTVVDTYLESINSAQDEAPSVHDNEPTQEVCECGCGKGTDIDEEGQVYCIECELPPK